jgi:hypothetical protein
MSDRNEMLRVKMPDGGVRRVNPRDKDAFMAANPGAIMMDGDETGEAPEAESKMVAKPAANKARQMGDVGKK